MRYNYFFFLLLIVCGCFSTDEKSEEQNGSIIRIDSFPSVIIDSRPVHIWLPPDYDSLMQHAVIYMHDGQMLFDSLTTWNNKEWHVDETISRLLSEKKIKDVIVVGIENNGARRSAEYFPEAVLAKLPKEFRDSLISTFLEGEPLADKYLMFLVHELKPYIDSVYSTFPDQGNTFIMGSSMGGLISLYAICEYPKIFGGAGCISTHWPLAVPNPHAEFDLPASFREYLDHSLPDPTDHKIYFDHGTATLDSLYEPYQILVDSIMIEHHYIQGKNWISRKFEGHEHSEVAWSKRLHIPLEFLLGT